MGADSSIVGDSKAGPSALASPAVAALLIAAIAVLTRIVAWWNPVAHVDDQFYLLAGEELLRGHWPYVDVWDRKPLGLFLLYAAIAWIGGGSILGLNLIATAFAAATAMVIRQIALRFASATAATLAACAYLIAMPVFGGQTGQSPVFYNLLIAGAAWLLFRASERTSLASIRWHAYGAMLLAGLAMTIKQVSLVEGAWFGLAFLWLMRRQGGNLRPTIATGLLMVLTALLPTGLAMAGYGLAGDTALAEFIYANFVSIFERQGWQPLAKIAGATYFLLFLLPLLGMGGWGAWHRHRTRPDDINHKLLLGWLVAALLGYLAVPAFFDHYTLPVLVPLCISAATLFDRSSRWLMFGGLAVFYLLEGSPRDLPGNRKDAATYGLIRRTVDQARHGGCPYVADGPSRLYSDFPGCRPTRFLFPDHLVLITEADAIGIDPAAEVSRILVQRPAVVVTRLTRRGRQLPEIRALFERTLPAQYRPVLTTPPGYSASVDGITVWQRNDLPPPKR